MPAALSKFGLFLVLENNKRKTIFSFNGKGIGSAYLPFFNKRVFCHFFGARTITRWIEGVGFLALGFLLLTVAPATIRETAKGSEDRGRGRGRGRAQKGYPRLRTS